MCFESHPYICGLIWWPNSLPERRLHLTQLGTRGHDRSLITRCERMRATRLPTSTDCVRMQRHNTSSAITAWRFLAMKLQKCLTKRSLAASKGPHCSAHPRSQASKFAIVYANPHLLVDLLLSMYSEQRGIASTFLFSIHLLRL